MEFNTYRASSPGSFMISGEHAVLRDKTAIVAAISQRIYVTLTPRDDQTILIKSNRLGEYKTHLSNIEVGPPFQFVLACIDHYKAILSHGFELTIEADFSHKLGLGSSAAVTTATVGVLTQLTEQNLTEREYFLKICKIIHSVQHLGSGADVAASVYGGAIAYTVDPLTFERIEYFPQMHLIYTGYKTPTPEVVETVSAQAKKHKAFYKGIFDAMGAASLGMKQAMNDKNWLLLGRWMDRHYCLQDAIQLACPKTKAIVDKLNKMGSILGAKISGSGLGDCVLALGELPDNAFETQIPVTLSEEGLVADEKAYC